MKLIEQLRRARVVQDTRGLSTVEYVIILALVAALCVGTWNTFGGNVKTYLEDSSGTIGGFVGSASQGQSTSGGGNSKSN